MATLLKKKSVIFAGIMVLFLFRLAFGLCSEFWFPDELQVYLIGLRFYTTGEFPFFGPDVVYTSSQIPGALQGLLVGLPFYLLPFPEAPYILLNLLSTSSLVLLVFYIRHRLPDIPLWFTLGWVLTCPWTMNYSTHIVNPSYVLPAAIVFFIAFFESVPSLSLKFIKTRTAFFLMGFCLFWIFQLHLSWVLLVPFIAAAIIIQFVKNRKESFMGLLWLAAGSLITGSLFIPTLIKFGFSTGSGGIGDNMVFNTKNLKEIITVLARYLSLASFELPRFIGSNNVQRMEFIREYWWASPFIIFAGITGFIQPLWMLVAAFIKNKNPHFKTIRLLAGISFLWIWLSFLFSVKNPSSHTFYVMFPLIMMYSFYCWQPLMKKKWIKITAALLLLSGIIFHSVLMFDNYHKKSMYQDSPEKNRSIPLKAIKEKNYRILGERRTEQKTTSLNSH